jgi:glutathionyl-hydroquinone reductase
MAKLIRFLRLDLEDFSSSLMDAVENAGKRRGFSETQAAYRKHTSDDMNTLAEVTEYLASVEAKLK